MIFKTERGPSHGLMARNTREISSKDKLMGKDIRYGQMDVAMKESSRLINNMAKEIFNTQIVEDMRANTMRTRNVEKERFTSWMARSTLASGVIISRMEMGFS